jgi:membrane-associated phospholipid phosphatase
MTVDVKSHSFFNTFAGIPEVLDKYLLIAGLLLFLCVSANSRREKRSLFWTIILSSLVALLVLTPIVHLLYYQPHPFSLSQLRLLVSEKNDWPFPNGHAAFLFAIATAMYLYRGCINKTVHLAAIATQTSQTSQDHSISDYHSTSDRIRLQSSTAMMGCSPND